MQDKNGNDIKAGDTLFNPHDRDSIERMRDMVDERADEGLYVVPSETHFLHPATERRLRDVIRQIDDGIGGGFRFAHWLSNSDSSEAARYFVTGRRNDSASLWYAPRGRSVRKECTRVGYTIHPLQSKRYAELAESLERHLGR